MPLKRRLKSYPKLSKTALVLLGLYIALVQLPRFCYKTTHNFWLQTILSDRTPDLRWQTDTPDIENLIKINQSLSQPFYFLGGGMQSFAFVSEDQRCVIKFFKHKTALRRKGRFRPHVPYLPSIFQSYHTASTLLSEETGILYAHLNKTKGLHGRIRLFDKMGSAHEIALDDTEFVLQRRAELLCPALRKEMECGDVIAAKAKLKSLFDLYKSIYSKGVKNYDSCIRRNFGFVDGKAVLIDAGALLFDERVKDSATAQRDILQKGANLEKWLKKHYPVLHEEFHRLSTTL